MRILTVRQPWAWAIIHGGKDVENRSRNIAGDYRGPVAIHAAMTLDDPADPRIGAAIRRLYVEPRRGIDEVPSIAGCDDPWLTNSPWFGYRGGIIGVADLIDVHHVDDCASISAWRVTQTERCSSWAEPNSWHLRLANPRPLPEPIPYKGALGLRELPPEVEALIWQQIGGPS